MEEDKNFKEFMEMAHGKTTPVTISVEDIEKVRRMKSDAFAEWQEHSNETEIRDKYWYKYIGISSILDALHLNGKESD